MAGEAFANAQRPPGGGKAYPVVVAILLGLSVLTFAGIALLPKAYTTTSAEGELSHITLVEMWVRHTMWLSGAACAGLVIVTAVVGRSLRRRAASVRLFLVAVLGLPLAAIRGCWISFFPWETCAEAEGADGTTYSLMVQGFGPEFTMALTRPETENAFLRRFEVLADNFNPFWTRVIRPTDPSDSPTIQLHVASSGMIVGTYWGPHALVAYDPATRSSFGRKNIVDLSPFVLIGPGTKMREGDIRELIAQEEREANLGRPSEVPLRAGLEHPNPAVRELAEKLLRIREGAEEVDHTPR